MLVVVYVCVCGWVGVYQVSPGNTHTFALSAATSASRVVLMDDVACTATSCSSDIWAQGEGGMKGACKKQREIKCVCIPKMVCAGKKPQGTRGSRMRGVKMCGCACVQGGGGGGDDD